MFTFVWPYVFCLLPLYWIVRQYFPNKKKHNEAALYVPFLMRIQSLSQQSEATIFPRKRKQFYAFCAWSLLLLAAANPQWLGEPITQRQESRNIMLAVDISPSMSMPDLQPRDRRNNRLQSVKDVATYFIDKRKGDKMGLVLFGTKAYLQTPLTFDRQTLRSMLDDASIGLAGNRTAIGDALGLAIKKLSTENIKSRLLILFTDGGNNAGNIDPIEAAEIAKENNIQIYTVGIGASQLVMNNVFGQGAIINPSADLDEGLLKNIANMTQGQYFRAQDQVALANILGSIDALEPVESDKQSVRPIIALFYWPLAAALFFIVLLIFPSNPNKKLSL